MSDSFYNNFPRTNNIVIGANSLNIGGSEVPEQTYLNNFSFVLGFKDGDTAESFFNLILPLDFVEGTNIDLVINWAPSNSSAGNIVWALEYEVIRPDNSEVLGGTPLTDTVTEATPQVTHEVVQSTSMTLTKSGMRKGDIINTRLYRNGNSGSDTYGEFIYLSSVLLTYTSLALGGP